MKIELKSTITCPVCLHQKIEEMPINSCLFMYKCEQCETVLIPNKADSCIFCSYGSSVCPHVQENHMEHIDLKVF